MKGSKTLGGVGIKAKETVEMEDGTRCTRTRRSEESVESKSDVYGENYMV